MGDMPGLDAIGRFTGRREMGLVASQLQAGETVRHAVQGRLGRRHGLLVATDRRIIWVTTGLVANQVRAWTYAEVEAVDVQIESPDVAHIELAATGPEGATLIEAVDKRDAQAFAAAIEKAAPHRAFRFVTMVDDPREASDPDEGLPPAERRLRRLDRMRAKGSVTEEEYRMNRARLLQAAGLPPDLPPPSRSSPGDENGGIPPWPGTKQDHKQRRYKL